MGFMDRLMGREKNTESDAFEASDAPEVSTPEVSDERLVHEDEDAPAQVAVGGYDRNEAYADARATEFSDYEE